MRLALFLAAATALLATLAPLLASAAVPPQSPLRSTGSSCVFTKDQHFIVNNVTMPVRTSPLLDYVFARDDAFMWYDTGKKYKGAGWTGSLLNVTSQRWMPDVSSRPTWWHSVLVIRPDKLNNSTDIASIYVTGDNNSDDGRPPKELSADVVVASLLAVETSSVVAILYNIPNQKIAFTKPDGSSTGNLGEDGLVAHTWAAYIDAPARAEQVIYLPMVKSVFATMDAISNYTATPEFQKNGTYPVPASRFIIAGASKRGATTWLTGVADAALPPAQRRVVGIVPIVFDVVDFANSVGQMFRNLNGWSFAFKDYRNHGVTQLIAQPERMELLTCIIDPIRYASFDQIAPALVVSATGDEFFQPSDDWSWWPRFVSPSSLHGSRHYRLHIGNAEHAMITGLGQLIESVRGFVTTLNSPVYDAKTSLPVVNITLATDGTVAMSASVKPYEVRLHQATSLPSSPLGRRDFRLIKGHTPAGPCVPPAILIADVCANPVLWNSKKVDAEHDAATDSWVAAARLPAPEAEGVYVGYYLEMKFKAQPKDLVFTSQVAMQPMAYPYEGCKTEQECLGELV